MRFAKTNSQLTATFHETVTVDSIGYTYALHSV